MDKIKKPAGRQKRAVRRSGKKRDVALVPPAGGQVQARTFMLSIRDSYSSEIKHFFCYLDESEGELNPEAIRAYRDDMVAAGSPVRSINKRLCAVKTRIRQLFDRQPEALDMAERYRLERTLKDIKLLKVQKSAIAKTHILELTEVQLLINDADTPDHISLIVEFLFHTGARISEALGIRLADLRERRNYIEARIIGKGSKERRLKVNSLLIERIKGELAGKEFLFERPDGKAYKRRAVYMAVRQHGERVLERQISPHTLRHSFATLRIRATGKIEAVSRYLGHASTAITLDMYVHEDLSINELELF